MREEERLIFEHAREARNKLMKTPGVHAVSIRVCFGERMQCAGLETGDIEAIGRLRPLGFWEKLRRDARGFFRK